MRTMSGLRAWLAAGVLMCAATAAAAAQLAPIAHSTQLTVEGGASAAGLTLRVRPTVPGAALTVTEVSVDVDGVSAHAAPQAVKIWTAKAVGG